MTPELVAAIVRGGYWLVPPGPGAESRGRLLRASSPRRRSRRTPMIREDIPGAGLARRHLGRPAARRLARRRPRTDRRQPGARSHVELLLDGLSPAAALVTVLDGHPATLSWLGSVARHRVVALGVDRFGQSGDIPDLYREYDLDVQAIVDAAARACLDQHAHVKGRLLHADRDPDASPDRLDDRRSRRRLAEAGGRTGDGRRGHRRDRGRQDDRGLKAPDDGTLTAIVVPAGSEKVEVGAVLAILEPGGDPARTVMEEPGSRSLRARTDTAAIRSGRPYVIRILSGDRPSRPLPQVVVDASPLARSMALQAGLELSSLRGSGPAGRIMQADVLTALGFHRPPAELQPPRPAVAASGQYFCASYDEIPHSRVRQVIAHRLTESKRTIPHFYLEANCRIDALLRLRSEVQAASADGIKLSLNDFAVRAAALALREVPDANASWTDTATRRYRRIDLAIAVAADAGLVAPIVRDADRKGLGEIAAELRDLARRARDGRLRPEELEGGTFTVSNLGMYGVDSLYAIVNPPQAGILGLGRAEPRPVVVDGSIVVATMMTLHPVGRPPRPRRRHRGAVPVDLQGPDRAAVDVDRPSRSRRTRNIAKPGWGIGKSAWPCNTGRQKQISQALSTIRKRGRMPQSAWV